MPGSAAVQIAGPATLNLGLPRYQREPTPELLAQRLPASELPPTASKLEIHRLLPVSTQVYYGALITGYVFVTPHSPIRAGDLKLAIVCTETAASNLAASSCKESHRGKCHKGYGELATITSGFGQCRIPVCSKTALQPGYRYAVPFCVEFPDPHCLGCDCGVAHHVLPPESQHIAYSLGVSLENIDGGHVASASLPLKIRPGAFLLDLKNYYDANDQCIHRVYSATLAFSRQRLFRRPDTRSMLSVRFSSSPVSHDIAKSFQSAISLRAQLGPNVSPGDVKVSRVLYYVFKIYSHAPRGMGKYIFEGPGRFYREELVSYGESVHKLTKRGLSVGYSLVGETQGDVIPSYVGCLTSVTYALDLIIFIGREKVRLRIPIVLKIGSLPSYEQLYNRT